MIDQIFVKKILLVDKLLIENILVIDKVLVEKINIVANVLAISKLRNLLVLVWALLLSNSLLL